MPGPVFGDFGGPAGSPKSTKNSARGRKSAPGDEPICWAILAKICSELQGECATTFGNIKVKQTLKPDGSITMKPENDEVLRLKLAHKKSSDEIRKKIEKTSKNFKAFENWK